MEFPGFSTVGRRARTVFVSVVVIVLGGALLAPGAMAAAPSPDAKAAPALAFTAWHLAELTTQGNPTVKPDAADAISLVFGAGDDVAVATANQCATGSGTLALHGDGSVVANVAMAAGSGQPCERRSVEERFLNLVNLATTWQLDEERLTLALMDGGTIVLAQSIVGTTWAWAGFQGGNGETTPPDADAPTTIVFRDDGTVVLTSSCGAVTAPYALEGTSGLRIDTSALPASDDPCLEGAQRTLGAMRSFVFRDGRLFVSLMADAGIHEFTAVAPSA